MTSAGERYAVYTTLTPGAYTFRVKGSNSDGVWNETGASIIIKIDPPFWQTLWFRILAFFLIVGVAITLYKRRLKNVRLITELKTAHDAQMSIMPQSDPELEGFEISGVCIPANEVGGDFFDYIWLDEEKSKFGIAVGDVSGKAMQSAMTAVMANGMIYSVALESLSVKDILTRMNKPMYNKTNKKMFTVLLLAQINLATKELIFTNAGLNEPLLKSNGKVTTLKSLGPKHPLGLVKDCVYEENKIHLHPDDILVLFTDGITEAQNSKRELYAEKRLINLLEQIDTKNLYAKEIKKIIINDIKKFTGKAGQFDDMTVVVIKNNN